MWTDGACSGNPGPGGWAWATKDGRQDSGGSPQTTNQRMEIQAVLEAVRALDGPLVVVSDSTYVVNCFRDRWWQGWLARGWLTSAKKPVANRDLWEPLVTEVRDRGDVTFRWVKGHSGDPMNDLVDLLAVAAAQTQRSQAAFATQRRRVVSRLSRLGLEVAQPVPGQVDQVGGHLRLLRLARAEPPLAGQRDHADQHLGVHRRRPGVQARLLELRRSGCRSTWEAMSFRMVANEPPVLPTEESRARIRKPSVWVSM